MRAKVEVFVELHRRALRIRRQEGQLREAERQRGEEALRESESQYEATFNQAPVGIAHLSLDGRWLRANRHLCDMLGYGEAELRSLPIRTWPIPRRRRRTCRPCRPWPRRATGAMAMAAATRSGRGPSARPG